MSFLSRTTFFIREHVGMFKMKDAFDILDPETGEKIGEAREEISGWVEFFRLLVNKSLLPTKVVVYELEGASRKRLFSIERGAVLLRAKVRIHDAQGLAVGSFRAKLFSLGVSFDILGKDEAPVGEVKGDWKGWNFKMLSGQTELGLVTKKWGGVGREFFTSADNYVVSLSGKPSPAAAMLLLAAGLAVDTVYKEKK